MTWVRNLIKRLLCEHHWARSPRWLQTGPANLELWECPKCGATTMMDKE